MYSILSRIPARIVIESKNPSAVKRPQTTLSMKLYPFVILFNATPTTAQFVVIKGRYTPSDACKDGINFFNTISTNCTNAAITRINTIVCK